jgi:hypothetical protein
MELSPEELVLRALFGEGPPTAEEISRRDASPAQLRALAAAADVAGRYEAACHPNTDAAVRGVLAHDSDDEVALAAMSHGAPVEQWRPNLLLAENPREFIRVAVRSGNPTTFLELSAFWAGSVADLALAVRDVID